MRLIIETEYNIGDIVYLYTDPDQHQRMVTAITYRGEGVRYELSCGTTETYHMGVEISRTKNVMI